MKVKLKFENCYNERYSEILTYDFRGNCRRGKLESHVLKRSHVTTTQLVTLNRVLARKITY